MMKIGSEKFVVRQLCPRADIAECTHTDLRGPAHGTPRLDGTADGSWAPSLYSMCLQNARLDQAQAKRCYQETDATEKMKQSRDAVNIRCMRLLLAQQTVSQQTFFYK